MSNEGANIGGKHCLYGFGRGCNHGHHGVTDVALPASVVVLMVVVTAIMAAAPIINARS